MNTDYTKAEKCLKLLNNPTLKSRGVHIEDAIPEDSLLFIGINPSFNKEDPIPGQKEYCATYQLANTANHRYFKKAYNIAMENNNLNFGHHDLFPIRERNQKVIENLFVDADGKLKPKEDNACFIEESLRWSEYTIRKACPQMIVVINAFACRIFFDYRFRDGRSLLGFQQGDKQLWNQELGADFIRINERTVPILFSGMLSGQRSLDNWSFNRLVWHIQHVLSNKEKWPK